MRTAFLSKSNNNYYNIKLARVLGLYSAVYLGLLMELNNEENLIKLSREDIFNLTGIDIEDQGRVEDNLESYSLIKVVAVKSTSRKNQYSLNEDLLLELLTSPEDCVNARLASLSTAHITREKPRSKRSIIIENLKKNIKSLDPSCKEYLEDWIDAATQKFGYISKSCVINMEDTLSQYAGGSVTLFTALCKLLTIVVYKDPKWVIARYEQDSGSNLSLNSVSQVETDDNLKQILIGGGQAF